MKSIILLFCIFTLIHSQTYSNFTYNLKNTTNSTPIPFLPENILTNMQGCSYRMSWFTANTRYGYTDDAKTDKLAYT